MASSDREEESSPNETEDDESKSNLNNNAQAIQDAQGERNTNIYNRGGKERKMPQPKKVAITHEKVSKS